MNLVDRFWAFLIGHKQPRQAGDSYTSFVDILNAALAA